MGAFVVAVFGLGMGALGISSTRDIVREREVLSRGEKVQLVELGGKVEKSSYLGIDVFYEYKLDVAYLDAAGTRRKAKVEFGTFWKPIDEQVSPELRVLAADPEHPAISWAKDAGLTRFHWPVFGFGMLLLTVFGIPQMLRHARKRENALRACALESEEVLLPVVSTRRDRGAWIVHYEVSPGATAKHVDQESPLIVTRDGRQHVVTLRSTSDDRFVVPGSLRGIELPDAARLEVIARAKA